MSHLYPHQSPATSTPALPPGHLGAAILQLAVLRSYVAFNSPPLLTGRFDDAEPRLKFQLREPAVTRLASEVVQSLPTCSIERFVELFVQSAQASTDPDVCALVRIAAYVDQREGLPAGFSLGIASVALYADGTQ